MGPYIQWFEPKSFYGFTLVGQSKVKIITGKKTNISDMWKQALALAPDLDTLGWPERSAEAEFASFAYQASVRKTTTFSEINEETKTRIMSIMTEDYPKFSNEYNDLESLLNNIRKQFLEIKLDSTPGIPYVLAYKKNKDILENFNYQLEEIIKSRIFLILSIDYDALLKMHPEDIVRKGLADPVRLFIKNEPHKKDKLDNRRYRLIMSVSIADKVLEMVLTSGRKKTERVNWRTCPSKPGIGFDDAEAIPFFKRVNSFENRVSSDVSAWDWLVREWMQIEDSKFTIKQCTNPFPEWEDLVRKMAIIESRSLYQFSDGNLAVLRDNDGCYYGNQNSGKYKTSMSNSSMRVRLALAVGSRHNDAMGDDLIETYVQDAEEKYKMLGMKVKAYDKFSGQFEFCSKIFTDKGPYPTSVVKPLMNLLHSDFDDSNQYLGSLINFSEEIRHFPNKERLYDIIEKVGYNELVGAQIILPEEECLDEDG